MYTLTGFFLLPWILESQLQQILQQRLQLDTRVERIYFNPYTFYLEVEGLQIDNTDASSLLSLGNLHVNFQASRLALLKLQFSEVDISDLNVSFKRDSVQQNTLSTLADRWTQSATADTEASVATEPESGDMIPLQIVSLQLSNIQLLVTDSVPSTEFSTSLQLASAQVNDFSTLPGERGDNAITIHFEDNARMEWQGGFSVNPLDFRGEISLTDFNVAATSRYFQDSLPFQLNSGLLHIGFAYDISLADDVPAVGLSDISVQLSQLAATEIDATSPFFGAQAIGFENGVVNIPQNTVVIPVATVEGLEINTTRDRDGIIDIQRMLNAMTGNMANASTASPDPVATAADNTTPWAIRLDELRIENNILQFTDQALRSPFTVSTTVNATLSNADNSPQTQMPVTIAIDVASGGSIDVEAELLVLPELNLAGTVTVNDIVLNLVQPYLDEYTSIQMQSGSLATNIDFISNGNEPLSLAGNASLSTLDLRDKTTDTGLFSLTELAIDDFSYSVAENSAEVSEILLTDPQARIVVFEDGSTNISRSLNGNSESSQTPVTDDDVQANDSATNTNNPLPAILIGRLSLTNASADFTDRNLPLVFNANIEQLNGAVNDISNTTSVLTNISLEGQVGEFGLLQFDADLDPFDFTQQSDIELVFTNIDLPSVTPYAVKFAGREIDAGDVDLDLKYTLKAGQLNANNQMVLSNLQLGARVEYPDAMDLPLDLALALLKNSNGVIDLEIPVTGDVNDPEFNFGPAIRRAISNILTNIVAAPFRLLGGLIGGGSDTSLDHMRFLPGRTDIAAPEQQRLQQLGEALLQRPQLVLEVPMVNAGAFDIAALQEAAVDLRIESVLATPEGETAAGSPPLSLTARRTLALEAMYSNASLDTPLTEIRLQHTTVPEPATDQAGAASQTLAAASGQLDVLAYNADLRQRLIDAETVSQSDIDSLARNRADNVVQYLVSTSGIDASRIRISESVEGDLDDDQWLIMNFDLSAR